MFAAITYIAPMMTEVAGFADGSVTWLLVLFGAGMFAGNLVGGRFADRAPMLMLVAPLTGLAVALAAPTLASAMNIGAFNLGNAISAWLGGLVIGAGFGYTAPNWVGAGLAASALLLALVAEALDRRSKRFAVNLVPANYISTNLAKQA